MFWSVPQCIYYGFLVLGWRVILKGNKPKLVLGPDYSYNLDPTDNTEPVDAFLFRYHT
jgi:hypothetical protein